jgi:hypothetical protein
VAAARVSLEQELELLKTEQTTLHYALQASTFYLPAFQSWLSQRVGENPHISAIGKNCFLPLTAALKS